MLIRDSIRAEWRRVYPGVPLRSDTLWGHFCKGCREGLAWYFAPLRLVWWILRGGWRN